MQARIALALSMIETSCGVFPIGEYQSRRRQSARPKEC